MNLKRAKSIPKFRSEAEEAAWWGTHDTTEIWNTGKPARRMTLPPGQAKHIRERAAERMAAISIRLEKGQIAAAKKIASRKSIGYQTQLRMWIAEGIGREA